MIVPVFMRSRRFHHSDNAVEHLHKEFLVASVFHRQAVVPVAVRKMR